MSLRSEANATGVGWRALVFNFLKESARKRVVGFDQKTKTTTISMTMTNVSITMAKVAFVALLLAFATIAAVRVGSSTVSDRI